MINFLVKTRLLRLNQFWPKMDMTAVFRPILFFFASLFLSIQWLVKRLSFGDVLCNSSIFDVKVLPVFCSPQV